MGLSMVGGKISFKLLMINGLFSKNGQRSRGDGRDSAVHTSGLGLVIGIRRLCPMLHSLKFLLVSR